MYSGNKSLGQFQDKRPGQTLAKLLHDVATCVEWTGQTHATYRNWVAKRTQHVVPNNVKRCCVEMLRAFGQALTYNRFLQFCLREVGMWFLVDVLLS